MNKAVFLNRKETADHIHAPKVFFKLKAQFMAQVFAKSANVNLDSPQSIFKANQGSRDRPEDTLLRR